MRTNLFCDEDLDSAWVGTDELVAMARAADYNTIRLAEVLNLAERTLYRQFHKKMGCPPGEWLARQRMSDAAQLLERGLTVKETAHAVGYRQTPQFTREFNRRLGCTPSNFLVRARVRQSVPVIDPLAWVAGTANILAGTANTPLLLQAAAG